MQEKVLVRDKHGTMSVTSGGHTATASFGEHMERRVRRWRRSKGPHSKVLDVVLRESHSPSIDIIPDHPLLISKFHTHGKDCTRERRGNHPEQVSHSCHNILQQGKAERRCDNLQTAARR